MGISAQPIPPVELTVAQAVQAEAEGFDSVFFPDHLMGWFPKSVWTPEASSIVTMLPSPHMYLDPMIVIALAGQSTERVLLATGVTDPIRRPPAELARTFLTLSHATGGRTILGIGAGELENTAPYGLDYRYQASRLEEALHIIRLLWESEEPVDFDGRFWKLKRAVMDLPSYDGKFPPVWVAAHGPRMLEITGRYGDGWYPSYPMTPEEYGEKLKVVRAAAEKAGRDPNAIVASYQLYAIIGEDHETTHEMMSRPLAAAMAVIATSELWERAGKKHPFGTDFQGLRDYVPEWLREGELQEAMDSYEIDVLHDTVAHGTAQEVIDRVEPYIEAGLQHVVLSNVGVLAGLEYLQPAREGLKVVAEALKS